jgi:UDP-N-acetylmuramoyl-L-alanyl-D-glutamate--2,6-diaminopimelate ligase
MKTDLGFSFLPVTCDTAKITIGSTFVACNGSQFRGIDFIPQAIQNGAVHIIAGTQHSQELVSIEQQNPNITFSYTSHPRKALAEEAAKAYGYPTKKLRFVGITGTKGKSTITHLIEHMLRKAGRKTALIGGVANKILDTSIPSSLTTPNSDFLQAFFAVCVKEGVDTVVMEVSSHALSLDRTYGIKFDAVGFTNLAQDHLDFYANMKAYCDAKILLFNQLKHTGQAIINLDHAWGHYVGEAAKSQLHSNQIITLSDQKLANSKLSILDSSLEGLKLSLVNHRQNNTLSLTSRYLFGRPFAYNIAMAGLIGQSLGIADEIITQALTSFTGTPGRLQLHVLKNGAKAFVDFAHSGPSMEAVLQMLRPLTDNLIVLFGCGGDRPKERRFLMPRVAGAFGDYIIITEDNPRTEDRLQILRDIEANIPLEAQHKTQTIQDRRQAIAAAISLATTPSSIVAILGKGHEPYQIIGTTHHHFDDFEEIKNF